MASRFLQHNGMNRSLEPNPPRSSEPCSQLLALSTLSEATLIFLRSAFLVFTLGISVPLLQRLRIKQITEWLCGSLQAISRLVLDER